MTAPGPARLMPPITQGLLGPALAQSRRPQRVLERHWLTSRRGFVWILIGGFFEPFFYLMSTQLGFRELVPDVDVDGRLVPYVVFVAPALLAASAMNGAMYETMNIFFRINYDRTYATMLATPMTAGDAVLGDVAWATIRGSLYSGAFLAVMAAMGMTGSWWSLALLPAATLVAVAFAGVGILVATYIRAVEDFEYVPTAMLPLFLFSATFFPASAYGSFRWVLHLSPLYHGVALLRAINLGQASWALVVHGLVLVVMAIGCTVAAARRVERRLLD